MKRIAAVILFAAFMALSCISAGAVGTVTAEVVSDNSISAGAEEEFILRISSAENVRTISITPKYSGEAFQFVSGRWLIAGVLADVGVETGSASIAFNNGSEVKGNIFSFTLKTGVDVQGEQSVGCEIAITYDDGTSETITADESKTVVGCNHVYTQKVLKAPSASEAGVAEYVCVVCGSSHKVILPPVVTEEEPTEESASGDLSVDIGDVSGEISAGEESSEESKYYPPANYNADDSNRTALIVAVVSIVFGGICVLIYLRGKKHTR